MLPSLLRQAEDSPEAKEYAAFAAWDAAAGDAVRRVCVPTRLYTRRLLVATVDQTWKTQLDRLAPQLIFRVNSLLGAPLVTQILFRIDPAVVRAANARGEPPPTLDRDAAKLAVELAPDAEPIEDSDMRDLFLRAASRCLARRDETP